MTDELKIGVEEIDGEFVAGIHGTSDIGISIDLFGHRGHGKTKEEAIADFNKNIFELTEECRRVEGRLFANIYKVYEIGMW